MCTSETPSLETAEEARLALFRENNPQCTFSMDDGNLVIENAWGANDIRFVFDPAESDVLEEMNNIAFRPQFNAIIHVDTNEIEFIFTYLHPGREPDSSYMDRAFQFHFMGHTFDCSFREPTQRLFHLAKRMRRLPPSRGYIIAPQLEAFRDYQRLDYMPERVKKYFSDRVPRSFFVRAETPLLDYDIALLSRHINFHMAYYDRKTPSIDILDAEEPDTQTQVVPRRFIDGAFPTAMVAHEIDDFVLQLIRVACTSAPRFAFIYYYQVVEYAGFYFVDEKSKRELRHFLSDPTIISCHEDKISHLLSVLCDMQQNHDARMQKVVEDFVDPGIVWHEIDNDKEFFSQEVRFDGDLVLPALVSSDITENTWRAMWMPKTFHQLAKIRHCLVHGRERRESQVIPPTRTNARHTARYLPVIRRIAEQIALAKA